MTLTAGLPLPVVKEIRALSGAWLACLVTMLAAAVMGAGQFRSLGVTAYFLGAAALGALSIGHEYSHRTLTMLLAQPARRERLLLAKLGVLLVMLLLLCTVAAVVLFNPSGSLRAPRSLLQRDYVLWALWLPVLGGLIVAPWLTMLCRNPIAGTVFTGTVPGLLWLAGELLGMAVYGRFAPEVDGFRLTFFRISAAGFLAIGAVMGWRMFMRLEAIEGRDPDVRLPEWIRVRAAAASAAAAPRHPVWMLVKKELHLQQMTFVVAALFVLGWLASVSLPHTDPQAFDMVHSLLTAFYTFLVALLIGSLASAEERQLGTIQWQVMLPVATAQQWIVKVMVAFGLTMIVAVGLPVLLSRLGPVLQPQFDGGLDFARVDVIGLLMFFTAGGLYVSSLCGSGVQALLISVAATPAMALVIQTVLIPLGTEVFRWSSRLSGEFPGLGMRPGDWRNPILLALPLVACFLVVVLRFAMVNHRSAERGGGRVVKQLMWMAACLAISVTLWAGLAGAIR